MDNKIIIAIVAVAVIVIAAVAVLATPQQPQPSADSVTYYGNGGTYNGQNSLVSKTETVVPFVFEKDGYHMVAWNTKADGSGTTYLPDERVNFGTALYAQWSDANTISTVNLNPSIFNLFLGTKGSAELVSFDEGTKEIPSGDAILVIKAAKSSDTISFDDGWIVIESGNTKNLIKFNIEGEGVTLGDVHSLEISVPAMYIDINQDGKNRQVSMDISFVHNTHN